MTDYRAGTTINALDFPPAVFNRDSTDITVASTSYADGSPQVSTTFVAPTSGRVLLTVGGGLRGDGTRRLHLSPVVKETNDSGTTILAPNVVTRGVGVQENATGYVYYSRTTLLEGLNPGQVYFAKTQHKSSAATGTAGFDSRDIYITPVP
ncbi:hypothetical protein Aph01nite_59170 [Acrocarpospora phusangensis]|uniref:Uncharacterized protein n=1 Tax=Acrocarpospora phusangensis TaxID=1070424 RepID=A0A919QES4_9ACTN|nr:hypothetical protein [Acrocarpospora phusangensis]GIH27607.1 hypothetical protein Aph01nite_59170 [Acrocarpospora phusangensis]